MARPSFAVTNDLNWSVSKRPLFFTGNDGQPVQWDEKVAIVRDDTGRGLGTVSPDYEIVQNETLLGLIKPMVDEGLLTIENMGYLKHGAKVFAQAKIAEDFRVLGEEYKAYITLLNGHTGNLSVAIGPAAVRVICGNTFAMAYAGIGERYRHMMGVNEKVLDSKAVINYVNAAMGKYAEHVETLAKTPCSPGQFNRAMSEIFDKDAAKIKQIQTLNDLFYNGAGNEGRTYYDAFNAVTDFSSNRSRRDSAGRFNYANFGAGSNLNQRAMRVLTELAVA
jgi:phage/plasmid-like protein (TIGR03299 family)